MESFESKPAFNIQKYLECVPGVSRVEKIELDEEFLDWAKDTFSVEVYNTLVENCTRVDAHKFSYISDGLSVRGYLWAPKEINGQLPVVVWNRGGNRDFGSMGEKRGVPYLILPAELAKKNMLVVASEYRGSPGSEGQDEFGGADFNDVVNIKKIADQLPVSSSEKAIVAGVSRGGMMSYLLASRESWVKSVISLAGTTDLIMGAEERPKMFEVFKETFGGSEEEMKKRSATYFYQDIPKEIPILMLHGDVDDRVSVEQARKLRDLLQSSGHDVEYHEFPGAGHNLSEVGSEQRKQTIEIINRFIIERK